MMRSETALPLSATARDQARRTRRPLRPAALAAALSLVCTLGAAWAQGPASKAELPAVQRAVHVCASCHGDFGRSTHKAYPALAGQTRDYMIRQMKDFRDQARAETDIQAYMWGISALLTDEQIEGLADYYAAQTPLPGKSRNARLEAEGKLIFEQGVGDHTVRACTSCHGTNAQGDGAAPRLAGLHADYVFRQLQAFKTPLRRHGNVMKSEAMALNDVQMKALAAYVMSK
ncbi:c-type cytochrome [Rubrivivax gelatinosus]|uniref:Cytochrome c553 n=1 Tax=Rubrivivax gelatinosus TaxID=28068 RepID=A0A4R2MD96_RUBGE|nr:c-type cytochrome [Rubrivivax gelatinosus]TCP02607.1 cytochrome c553 [Rubrivivax gelatinosus]